MSGWCGSGGSALATAGERTSAAAQPNRSAMASELEFHFDSLEALNQYSRLQPMIGTCL
jgi:hypothetical protein